MLSYGYRNKLGDIERIIQFYIRRFYRIAPLFYFSLLVWLTLNILFLGTKPDLQTFILNITFLFGLVPGAHESLVWAGWSIGIEMLFYAIFPLLLGICHNIRNTAIGWTLAIIVSSSYYKALIGAGMDSYAYMSIFSRCLFSLAGYLPTGSGRRCVFTRISGLACFFTPRGLLVVILLLEMKGSMSNSGA